MFPGSKPAPIQLWHDTRRLVQQKQIPGTDPLKALIRVAELPRPTAAVVVKQTRPKYPSAMRRAGTAGEVIVSFRVKETGKAAELKAERSSQGEFEAAALACVAEWQFKPATVLGNPIAEAERRSASIVFTLGPE